jgi:hypothetical protein
MSLALLLSALSAVLWGVAYVALVPLDNLSPWTINFYYGATMVASNGIALSVTGKWSEVTELHDVSLILAFVGYLVANVVASFVFLLGFQLVADSFAGGYTAISSCYPAITFVLAFAILKQQNFNVPLAVAGLVCTTAGVVMIALSK